MESRLPGLAERLRRHGESVAHLARAGVAVAERLGVIARAKRAERQNERAYWQDVAERATKTSEQAQSQSQMRRPARRR